MKLHAKGFLRFVASVLMVAALGLVSGVAATEALVSTPVAAECENDECEHYWWGDKCIDNPGGNTKCEMDGNNCKTFGCGVE